MTSVIVDVISDLVKHVLKELKVKYTEEQLQKALSTFRSQEQPVEKKKPPSKTKATKEVKEVKNKVEEKHKCEYRGTRGKNSDQVCGKLAKIEIDGQWFCGNDKGNNEYTAHAKSAYLSYQRRLAEEKKKKEKEKAQSKTQTKAKPKTKAKTLPEAKKTADDSSKKL